MAQLKIRRMTALPGTLEAHTVYMIAPAARPDYVEIYVTGTAGTIIKRVISEDDVKLLISDAFAAARELKIVDGIAERDALVPTKAEYVYVVDATADTSVLSGGATYLYRPDYYTWIKISEAESLDVAATWASLTDKPSSTPAEIDDAVSKIHTHSNKTQLDKIDEDGDGQFTYNGALPHIAWDASEW